MQLDRETENVVEVVAFLTRLKAVSCPTPNSYWRMLLKWLGKQKSAVAVRPLRANIALFVGQFAGGMSHHLSNTFSVTLVKAKIFYEALGDSNQQAYMLNIIKKTQAAACMNRQVFTFAKHQYASFNGY